MLAHQLVGHALAEIYFPAIFVDAVARFREAGCKIFLAATVGGMDAAVERTWMYLQRVAARNMFQPVPELRNSQRSLPPTVAPGNIFHPALLPPNRH
ncbi:MAG: hypothetical protein KJP25_03060 [Gammaproteobacteria bacterium]|nr:hypothetical protein [Gammaproteobacteria bacterium]MBT8150352.1 hypothetical protein [Gammaproteobacteria bacterium]NNM11260.1 hypothetical protein [Pseudomonadales bacterium]